MSGLPTDCVLSYDKEKWLQFIESNCLLKLDILAEENDKNWRYLARS